MKSQQLTSVGLVVSVVYGALIAILAMLHVEQLGTVAAIGAILLGLMWVVIGVVRRSHNAT